MRRRCTIWRERVATARRAWSPGSGARGSSRCSNTGAPLGGGVAQPAQASRRVLLDRADRATQGGGHGFLGEISEIAKGENLPLALGERRQCLIEVEAVGGDLVEGRIVGGREQALPGRPPELVQSQVRGHP